MSDLIGSSVCPICGVDTPHAHTKASIASEYREQWLQAKFEKHLLHWFCRYKDVLPCSYGMGIHLTKKVSGPVGTYWWWPVEMIWAFFRIGTSLFAPPLPDDSIPDVNEALEIKKYPFGKGYGEIYEKDPNNG
jgi:hypothetical protein